ncbi:porin [Paraburkholderia caffeinilytica]|uniref:porin n=1 Tax=Paraburkholderia caffeinilytica TaxID=1761016 RepID=UPI0038B91807
MKRSLLACGVLSICAGSAWAQSSVTLYGILDEGLNYNSNSGGARLYNMSSSVLQGSRWGLRGAEDLGGGARAIFMVENGFDLGTGKMSQGGLLFGRQAYVGIASQYGRITLGRQYSPLDEMVGLLEAGTQWGGSLAVHPGDMDNFDSTLRINNSVKYTNSFGGLSLGGLYSLGGVAGDFTHNQIWSVALGYVNGPLVLGVGYLDVRDPNTSFFGNGGSPAAVVGGVPGNNMTAAVYSGYASASTQGIFGTGFAYTIGAATVGGTYSNIRFSGLGNKAAGPNPSGYKGSVTFNDIEVNFKYQFTPTLLAGVAYNYTRGSSLNGADPAKYNQFSAGVDYFLSKRTDIYVIGVYQAASGKDSTGHAAVAQINQLSASTSDRQGVVRLGIRHKF